MRDGEPGAQHGAVGPVEVQQRCRGIFVEPALDPHLEVAPGPRRADPLTLQVQIGDLIEGVDRTQARIELQAVDDADRVIEPDVLGPHIPVPVDDAASLNARLQHGAVLGQEAPLGTVNAQDEHRRQAEAGIEQDAAVCSEARRPFGEVCAGGNENGARVPVEAHQSGGQTAIGAGVARREESWQSVTPTIDVPSADAYADKIMAAGGVIVRPRR
jgi:hypothetical protein